MRRQDRPTRLFAVLCLAGVLTACSAGPSTRPEIALRDDGGTTGQPASSAPASSSNQPTLPPLDEPDGATVSWSNCAQDIRDLLAQQSVPATIAVQCARINGVLDSPYAPGRGVTRMQVLKAGTGPIPVVVVNDVDGLPGTVYAARLATTLPADLLAKFSLVGVDRRGTGNSDPVRCVPEDDRATMVDDDPHGLAVEEWIDAARNAGQQCAITLESRLPALDTWRTSADIDSIRQALGMAHLNAIGHGEGSRVLTVFADRFPDKVGRMVLDGVPDPVQDASVSLQAVATSADAAFTAFAADCARRNCPIAPDPKAALSELLGKLGSQGEVASSGATLTAGAALRAVQLGLGDPKNWPALATAIGRARDGQPDDLTAMISSFTEETADLPARFDAWLVTDCNDTKTRLATEKVVSTTKDWNSRFPVFGALVAEQLAVCSPWPVPSSALPTPTARGAAPVVVLGTATDPITPLDGSQHAAQQLASASLVSWQGTGHGALGFSGCATDAAREYLLNGRIPRDGTVCPP